MLASVISSSVFRGAIMLSGPIKGVKAECGNCRAEVSHEKKMDYLAEARVKQTRTTPPVGKQSCTASIHQTNQDDC